MQDDIEKLREWLAEQIDLSKDSVNAEERRAYRLVLDHIDASYSDEEEG